MILALTIMSYSIDRQIIGVLLEPIKIIFTYGLTNCGAISLTVWPIAVISMIDTPFIVQDETNPKLNTLMPF